MLTPTPCKCYLWFGVKSVINSLNSRQSARRDSEVYIFSLILVYTLYKYIKKCIKIIKWLTWCHSK